MRYFLGKIVKIIVAVYYREINYRISLKIEAVNHLYLVSFSVNNDLCIIEFKFDHLISQC